MRATASAVPEEATATSKPICSTSCSNTASAERTCCRHDDTALGCRPSPGKKRSLRRTAPSFMLRAASVSPRWPTSSSVLPPPMSVRNTFWSNDRHGLQHPEVDEAGLLDAGDHLDVDAGAAGPGR